MAETNMKNALIGIVSLGVGLTGAYILGSWAPSRFFPSCTYQLAIAVDSIALFSFTYWLLHKIFDDDETHEILVQEYEHRRVKVRVPAANSNDSDMLISCDSDMLGPSLSPSVSPWNQS